MTVFDDMMAKVVDAAGFLAALDQSGGSTPKALKQYGITDSVRISPISLYVVEQKTFSHFRLQSSLCLLLSLHVVCVTYVM